MPRRFELLAYLAIPAFSSCEASFVNAFVEVLKKAGTIAENEFVDPNLKSVHKTAFYESGDLPEAFFNSFANLETKFGLTSGSIHFDARSR